MKNTVPYQAISLDFEMPAACPNDEIYVRQLIYRQCQTYKQIDESSEVREHKCTN